ncbi:MAG: type IV secretory system conjugative DNA transfer family protein [Anderseniella sp.]
MSFRPIYEGWDIPGRLSRRIRQAFVGIGLNNDVRGAQQLVREIHTKLEERDLNTPAGQAAFASEIVVLAVGYRKADQIAFTGHLTRIVYELIAHEGWFSIPKPEAIVGMSRSELWEIEDHLSRTNTIIENIDDIQDLTANLINSLIRPLLDQHPQLHSQKTEMADEIFFLTNLENVIENLPQTVEHVLQTPFAPELDEPALFPRLRDRLEYNLHVASGGGPNDGERVRSAKLPTKQSAIQGSQLIETYLGGTPVEGLLDHPLEIVLPTVTRFEHHHIVAGSGHGKTQTLQQLILHDLEAVERGEASIVVIDSQSDLINNIAGLECFAPDRPLADRLVLIDPTDLEWPVALNLFDVGLDRLDQYSQLDRERLTNSILELYDFVLGSLLDAGMTQKQTVIFRYITRLLLHIPDATIHTLRALLEDGGYDKYQEHIAKLSGSARAFFENEFNGREFSATKRQVLRRLYGILENQTFERMFSHPKSKLDLFTEMNAGKVVLINTAKDLLKESGTEIFGRFFIAMITQAAQERATLESADRLPTFVYVDEANDYFDRNIGIILSQARKYNVGMILAHQFLGQLDGKLQEAISANTSIKFAGGVSAKDARTLSNDLRTEPSFIERQKKLCFATFIKGQTERAVSIAIEPGQLETRSRMDEENQQAMRERMRREFAVHFSELETDQKATDPPSEDGLDNGEPMEW